MLICPDCHQPLAGNEPSNCTHCGWSCEFVDRVPVLLSSFDQSSPSFRDYMENYDEIAADDLAESIQPADYLARAAETIVSYVGPVEGLRVCEIGVGQGMLFDKLLASSPSSLTGVDISPAYLRRYRSRIEGGTAVSLVLANAENLPYREAFDLVVASEILEHVLNAGDFLISLHRCLRARGRAVVRVPYKEDLRQYARQNGCPYRFVHLRTFTRDSFVDMMRRAGFKTRHVHYDGYFGGRRRRPIAILGPLMRPYFNRRLRNNVPQPTMSRIMQWLLLQPITLTAVFEKV
jgi:SAM-dependent methyltransferase